MRGGTIVLWAAGLCVALIAAAGGAVYVFGQRPDYAWRPELAERTYAGDSPLVVIDEAHNNASTADPLGRYLPFADLLRADGYRTARGRSAFTSSSLESVDVLVIANAAGARKAQIWGFNLPTFAGGDRGAPAFTSAEIEAVRAWVEQGGSLLLIADHAPFGAASAALAQAFGVTMHQGFVETPGEASDPLAFARANNRLGDHVIVAGDSDATRIDRVLTFTGQSLTGPANAAPLLLLPPSAIEYVETGDALEAQPAGPLQGLALEYGAGRVVVLGEAAMLTAQVSNGEPFGMNLPNNDNKQFALNTLHWLSRAD